MRKEIEEYFFEQYEKQDFRVVPGHWPDFKSKEEIDKWIELKNKIMELMETESRR